MAVSRVKFRVAQNEALGVDEVAETDAVVCGGVAVTIRSNTAREPGIGANRGVEIASTNNTVAAVLSPLLRHSPFQLLVELGFGGVTSFDAVLRCVNGENGELDAMDFQPHFQNSTSFHTLICQYRNSVAGY